LLVDIEGLSASTLAEVLLLEVKLCSKATLMNIIIPSSLESEKSRMRSICRCKSSNNIINYFIMANENLQRKINLSIVLAQLLLAESYNELTRSDGFLHIFYLIVIVI
jgi:hypothetical protein